MRRARSVALATLFSAAIFLAGQAATAVSAPVSFGATIDKFSQPANAEAGRRCSDEIDTAESCTWVGIVAYHNASHSRAPLTGTIGTVKLVSCIGGSFIIQMATPARVTGRASCATVPRSTTRLIRRRSAAERTATRSWCSPSPSR